MAVKKKKDKLKAELKSALQAEIGRKKLLQAILKRKKPVSVLRRVEDTIPNVLVKRRDEEIKPTFFSRKGMI